MNRLDEMDFNEIKICYKDIFKSLIDPKQFEIISNKIENQYNEYIEYINIKKYKSPNTMGRGAIKYGRNIIWGWYIEDLVMLILAKNNQIKSIEKLGGDKSNSFIYDNNERKIKIEGEKTVIPDFKIINTDGVEYCIELKTAAKEVFTIKQGNIEQLYKEPAVNNRITVILMIDLSNKLYSIENLKYFTNLHPFPNQRMEGQLCYNFPVPNKLLKNLEQENFNLYLDESIFLLDYVKKLKALDTAIKTNNEIFKRIIEAKLKIEKLRINIEINNELWDKKIKSIQQKCSRSENISWDEIYKELNLFIE